jgi:SAM-dependent methyltransferase
LDEFGALRAGPRPRLLDFGSGAGRVTRFLVGHDELFEIHGTDVHPEQVAWCRDHLRPLRFARNEPTPPLSYPDAHFDGVWALSVFTHLDAEASARWRAELARVLKPGGVLVATLHGPAATARLVADDEVRASFRLDGAGAARLAETLAERGFVFLPYDDDVLRTAQAGARYGSAFFAPEAARRAFDGEGLRLLAYRSAALRGWQDVVVARKA